MPDLNAPAAPVSLDEENPVAAARLSATRFVLMEPSHPGNVGAAARALKTMGFARLVLVRPKDPAVLSRAEAVALASGALDVLAQAQVVDTLDQALAGATWTLALSARRREYEPPLLSARQAALEAVIHTADTAHGQIALLFGTERTGLGNAEVERCSALVQIPANPVYSSLNLAQAVQLLAYELRVAYLDGGARPATGASRAAELSEPFEPSAPRAPKLLASNDQVEGMFEHLQTALVALEFLDPENPKKLMSRLRRMFARTALEPEEVNILRGIAKHVLERVGGPRRD